MKKLFLKPILIISTIILVVSCKTEQTEKSYTDLEIAEESKKLNDFLQTSFDSMVDRSPKLQTRLGIKKDYGELDDISPAAEERELDIRKEQLAWLTDSITVDALSKDALLSYKLYRQKLENDIEDYKYRLYNYPVNQMHGAQSGMPAFLINMHSIGSVADAEAYISRLNSFNTYFAQVVDNLKEREVIGIALPKFVYNKVVQDSENILVGQPFDNSDIQSTLLEDFMKKVTKLQIDEDAKATLKKQVNQALESSVKPAYEGLISFIKEQKERANTDDGAWKFPDGTAFYSNSLNRTTTTDLTAEEIHKIGLAEVERLHKEMDAIREKVKFDGDLQAFFEFMRTDKQFYYPANEEGRNAYLSEAVSLIDSMKTRLDEIFITQPKAELMVKPVEPFREKSAGKAFYNRPAADGSRPGIYYANLYDMESMPTYQMEALAYHEGIPGHHMQLAIQQELEEVPRFRKFGGYTAYTEGWGFYSEFIPKEKPTEKQSLYDISINSLDGKTIPLSDFKGKKILFVNVASECGFTKQYKELQELSDTYADKLVVIGSPCNQFGKQEPGNASQIQEFCELNFGVTFLLTEKIEVKGSSQHPLYKWLTSKNLNGKTSSSVKWNFQKYLVDDNGNLIDYYFSITKPMSSKITRHL